MEKTRLTVSLMVTSHLKNSICNAMFPMQIQWEQHMGTTTDDIKTHRCLVSTHSG